MGILLPIPVHIQVPQILEPVGLSKELVNEYFTGTPSRIDGIDINTLEVETLLCHGLAYPNRIVESNNLGVGGHYAFRQRGEKHLLTS